MDTVCKDSLERIAFAKDGPLRGNHRATVHGRTDPTFQQRRLIFEGVCVGGLPGAAVLAVVGFPPVVRGPTVPVHWSLL